MNNLEPVQKKDFIKNKISRIKINENSFTNLLFKTYVNSIKSNFVDCYSYLIFSLNINNQYIERAFNFSELSKFICACEAKIDLILKNSQNLKNLEFRTKENINKFQLKFQSSPAFNNEEFYILVSFNNEGKMILDFMTRNSDKNGLSILGSFQFLDFKAFIEELNVIKNSWFNLQNSNISLYRELRNNYNTNPTSRQNDTSTESHPETPIQSLDNVNITDQNKSTTNNYNPGNTSENQESFSELLEIYKDMDVDLKQDIKNFESANNQTSRTETPMVQSDDFGEW